jgi:Cu+-exporting ATPase
MEENLHEEIIDVKGMHCKSCTENIQSKLSNLKGVEKTRVSLVEEKAFIKFDPTKTNLEEIRREIENLGYKTEISSDVVPTSHDNSRKGSLRQGIIYGLIPHIGCIAFIIGSVLGVTVLTQLFRPLLLNPYFFDILIALSLGFATLSSALYLRRNGLLSTAGAKRKWKYLSTMYGSTVGINLLLFLVIFPLLANVSFAAPTGNLLALNGLSSLKLQVDIPCSGHATLISGDLKTIDGVVGVQFSLPNIFDVKYDPSKTSQQQILALDVFKTYKATVLDQSNSQVNVVNANGVTSPVSGNSLATVTNGVQTIQLSVQGSTYYPNPIRVKVGIPVRLVADINNMPGCSKSIVIPEFSVSKYVSASDNVIEFTPTKSGTFQFSCSMNMYHGQIVVENSDGSVASYTGSAPVNSGGTCGGPSGGCGCGGR